MPATCAEAHRSLPRKVRCKCSAAAVDSGTREHRCPELRNQFLPAPVAVCVFMSVEGFGLTTSIVRGHVSPNPDTSPHRLISPKTRLEGESISPNLLFHHPAKSGRSLEFCTGQRRTPKRETAKPLCIDLPDLQLCTMALPGARHATAGRVPVPPYTLVTDGSSQFGTSDAL